MKINNPLKYRNALLLAFCIALLQNAFFIIVFFVGRDAFGTPDGVISEQVNFSVARFITGFTSNFVLAAVLFLLNFKLLRSPLKSGKKIVLIILLSILATALISSLISLAQLILFTPPPFVEKLFIGSLVRDIVVAALVVFISQVIYLNYKKQQISMQYDLLNMENMKTKYESLKNQMNPHFLFNSLGTLKSLIRTNPDKAQQYVQQFSFVFRYTIQNKDLVSLREELEFMKAYGELMRIRYGDNLRIDMNIDTQYDDYPVIPLSIQTLVENAIKHNVISRKFPLHITIAVNKDGSLVISNPIRLKQEPEPGEGIGLANLSERYVLRFNQDITINNRDNKFEIILPLIKL